MTREAMWEIPLMGGLQRTADTPRAWARAPAAVRAPRSKTRARTAPQPTGPKGPGLSKTARRSAACTTQASASPPSAPAPT
eukprot:16025772-Heterocapsa_arctica.AAC.1